MPVSSQGPPLAVKLPLIKPSGSAVPRKVIVPLVVLISRFTDLPTMKLAVGNVPDVIVPESKHRSKLKVPVRPKLPSEVAPS